MAKTKTGGQVKAEFKRKGITVTQWARDHGFPPNAVYQVLNGFARGYHGQAYKIAVALGLVIPDTDTSDIAA